MIYTAVSGERDNPRDDILCFTDYDRFRTGRMNAKIYKVLSHLFIPGEWSIWIDANLHLKVPERELIKLCKTDIAVFENPYRDNIYTEAEEIKRLKLDDPDIVDSQMERNPNVKGLAACFLIIRRNTPKIARENERWWAEICRGSSRDQLSFPYVYQDVTYLPKVEPFDNQYFTRVSHT